MKILRQFLKQANNHFYQNGEITIRKNANPKGVHTFMASAKPIFDVKLLPKKILITADGDGYVINLITQSSLITKRKENLKFSEM